MKNSLTCNETDTNTPNDILVGFNTCNNAKGLMNQEDITEIHKEQKRMLAQLEKVNQMLIGCNDISEEQYIKLLSNFQKHTAVLVDMKKNLQFLHTHIRQLKGRLHEKYPEMKKTIDPTKPINVTSVIGFEDKKTE